MTDRFKANPGSVTWSGGLVGGTDQVLAGLIAKKIGSDPKTVNFIPNNSGGELVAAVLGKHVTLGIAGWQEFAQYVKNGSMRVIGVAAPERVAGIDAPTLREQGVDVVLSNWRGVVAPAGLSEAQIATLKATFETLAKSDEWKEILAKRGWIDLYAGPEEFKRFISEQTEDVGGILKTLGLAK